MLANVFGRDLFDDFFDMPFRGDHRQTGLMRCDVKETAGGYELAIDLPGVKKEDVKAEIKDGCLTVSATTGYDDGEQDAQGRYIRRERYSGSFQRSFYVGEDITPEDIQASFADGVLKLSVPKKEALPKPEENHSITIG